MLGESFPGVGFAVRASGTIDRTHICGHPAVHGVDATQTRAIFASWSLCRAPRAAAATLRGSTAPQQKSTNEATEACQRRRRYRLSSAEPAETVADGRGSMEVRSRCRLAASACTLCAEAHGCVARVHGLLASM